MLKKSLKKVKGYQKKAVEFGLHRPYCGLFIDMGLGKTLIVLLIIEHLKIFGGFDKVLILAPLKVAELTWPDEIKEWGFDFSYEVLTGKAYKRKQQIQKDVDLTIINFDMIPWLVKQKEFKKFRILVVDEISKMKSTKTTRFKAFKKHLRQFNRRIGMTGTPVANHLMDVYGIMHVIDSGMTFPSKMEYTSQYFINVSEQDYPVYVPIPNAEERIIKRIAPNVLAMSAEDYGDLPPYMDQDIKIKLPPGARKLYEKLERDFFAKIGDEIVDIETASTLSIKLRQLVSGFLYNDGVTIQINKRRLDATKEIVENLEGESVMIAYYFEESKQRLMKMFPDHVHFGKGVKGKKLKDAERAWNEKQCPTALIHPQSAGHGLNFQFGGHHILWYELMFQMEAYLQTGARLRRTGQPSPWIGRHHILFENTIDMAMVDSMRVKVDTHHRVFDALQDYRRNR